MMRAVIRYHFHEYFTLWLFAKLLGTQVGPNNKYQINIDERDKLL